MGNRDSTSDWQSDLQLLRRHGDQLSSYETHVVNLIASDNAYPTTFATQPVYAGRMVQEGLPGRRPFAGAALHDEIETLGARVACDVFGADHANLQPHSCSQANQAAYQALLRQGDRALALNFQGGGHLTHGMKANFSGAAYDFFHFGVGEDGRIDYGAAERIAVETQPRLIVCGSSSYPRLFDAPKLRSIADRVGAHLMFDLSHEAGLIAGGAIPNPVPLADVTTMSLDKTLRGPFGGLILCRRVLAESIDKGVHPGTQSSFSVRKISEAAHALIMTRTPGFKAYVRQTLANAKVLEHHFAGTPELLVSGGTDKHYVVLHVKAAFGLSGERAERALEHIGILSSRQTVPADVSRRMADAGGLRLGTAWVTSRGYVESDIEILCTIIRQALDGTGCPDQLSRQVADLAARRRTGDVWAAGGTEYDA